MSVFRILKTRILIAARENHPKIQNNTINLPSKLPRNVCFPGYVYLQLLWEAIYSSTLTYDLSQHSENSLTFPAAIETIIFKWIINKNRVLWHHVYIIYVFSFKYGEVCLFLSEMSDLLIWFSLCLIAVIVKT